MEYIMDTWPGIKGSIGIISDLNECLQPNKLWNTNNGLFYVYVVEAWHGGIFV